VAHRFVTGTAWVLTASVLQGILRFALIAILTRHLGLHYYGLWAVFLATVEILIPVSEMGMRYGYSRYQAGSHRDADAASALYAVLCAALLSSVCVGALLYLGADWFASRFMDGSALGRDMAQAGSLIIAFGAMELIVREQFGTFLEMRARGAIIVARFLLDIVVALLAWRLGWGLVPIVMAMTASRFLPTAVGLAVVVWRSGFVRPAWSMVGPFVRFGAPLQLAAVASLIMRLGDRQVVALLRPGSDVGVFSAAADVGSMLLMLVVTVQPGLFPALAGLFNQGQRERAVWLFEKTLLYFLFVAIPTTVFLSVKAHAVLSLLTTAEFAEAGAILVPPIAVGTLLLGVAAMSRNLLGLVHETARAMWIYVAAVVVKLALTYACVSAWGLRGVWVAVPVQALLLVAAMRWVSWRRLAWRLDVAAVGKAVAAAVAAAVPAYFIHGESVLGFLGAAACFGVVFTALMLALGAVRLDELRALRDMLLRRTDGNAAGAAPGGSPPAE
jgi:O-antigen/teichoic acid export membrane protein